VFIWIVIINYWINRIILNNWNYFLYWIILKALVRCIFITNNFFLKNPMYIFCYNYYCTIVWIKLTWTATVILPNTQSVKLEDDFLLNATSKIAHLCAYNVVLWQDFTETVTHNNRVKMVLAKEYHQSRVSYLPCWSRSFMGVLPMYVATFAVVIIPACPTCVAIALPRVLYKL